MSIETQNQLTTDVTAVNNMPASGRREAVVGDTLNFQPAVTIGTATLTIARKPATSTATVSGTSLTFDVPGLYSLNLTSAGITRPLVVIAFPSAALSLTPLVGSVTTRVQTTEEKRLVLRAIAQDPAINATTCAASIELASPGGTLGIDSRLLGGAPFSWVNYGAPYSPVAS